MSAAPKELEQWGWGGEINVIILNPEAAYTIY